MSEENKKIAHDIVYDSQYFNHNFKRNNELEKNIKIYLDAKDSSIKDLEQRLRERDAEIEAIQKAKWLTCPSSEAALITKDPKLIVGIKNACHPHWVYSEAEFSTKLNSLEKQLSEKEAEIEKRVVMYVEIAESCNKLLVRIKELEERVIGLQGLDIANEGIIKSLEAEIAGLKEERKKMSDVRYAWKDDVARLSQKLSDLEKEQDILVTTYEQKLEKAVEALQYICDNCDSEQEKWAEKTAEEALKDLTSEESK